MTAWFRCVLITGRFNFYPLMRALNTQRIYILKKMGLEKTPGIGVGCVPVVRRPNCSKVHLFEISNKWAFEQVERPSCSKTEKSSMRSCSKAQLFEISNKWAFEQVRRPSCQLVRKLIKSSMRRCFSFLTTRTSHLFEGPLVQNFEEVDRRTTGPSKNCA